MWTEDEVKAFRLYCGPSHRRINDYLRGIEDGDAEVRAAVASLDRAIARSRVRDDLIAYRGVNGDAAAYIRRMNLQVGDGFIDSGYASTSMTPEAARLFAAWPPGGLILGVHIRSGMIGIDMSTFSSYPDEGEFLLPRGTEFRLLAAETADSILVEAIHG